MSLDQVIERIKTRVAAVDPNGPRKVLGVFQLDVKTGGAVEQWIVDLKQLKVEKGTASSPDVTVGLSVEDLIAISAKTVTIGDALKEGKITVTGDKELANKLADVI
ncbi:uncharacterized protein LOC129739021 [Uranotaenia lowii]|uniref:uncharacterized protein LOC129739021 n=1 Tax=Uranotaenia lowii TaxID=190385 RepID=UPI00247910A3|nr:uncharacterized protein LOC129739021 [Uranotaenia lowii]